MISVSNGGKAKAAAGRAFLRSLNILLKFTRLYGFEHIRTAEQYHVAWNELLAAMGKEATGGLLLGVSGQKLLLDGVPMDPSPAERSFAELLTQAGLASISFTPSVSPAEFAELVKAAPAPCTARAAMSVTPLVATPASSEAAVKITSPATNALRRP